MKFDVITIFPNTIKSYVDESILGRAQKAKKISVGLYNPRDFVTGKYKKVWPDGNVSRQVDDRPYGGGPGMVMRAEPILKAVAKAQSKSKTKKTKVIIFSATGKVFTNDMARNFVKKYDHLILISGRYEGIDARVTKILKALELSIGPYVLSGGEVPAMVVIDAVSRQIPGVLGKFESVEENRVSATDVYTRPEVLPYKGKNYRVPKVLTTGNHAKIEEWKKSKKHISI